jgi:N-acetylmuramoyl-L-alanine amidase
MNVYVDAGHGGGDIGASAVGVREKDVVLGYALRLRLELVQRGHAVTMSRETDWYPTLDARSRQANEAGVDCFVSIHANASGNTAAQGFQAFHAAGSERGEALARDILEAARPIVGTTRWTGVWPDETPQIGNRRIHVLRATRMPAVLLELGFLTNARDRELMLDSRHRDALCVAIADGIERWGGVERKDPEDLPARVWSRTVVPGGAWIYPTEVRGDREWYYLTERQMRRGIVGQAQATTPLSQMPRGPDA